MSTDSNTRALLVGIADELVRQADAAKRTAHAIGTALADLGAAPAANEPIECDGDGGTRGPECDCANCATDGPSDDAASFAETDKRLAELATIADRVLNAGSDANSCYWISDDGVIHDVEVHSGVVSFDLACRIAAHNATMRAAE